MSTEIEQVMSSNPSILYVDNNRQIGVVSWDWDSYVLKRIVSGLVNMLNPPFPCCAVVVISVNDEIGVSPEVDYLIGVFSNIKHWWSEG